MKGHTLVPCNSFYLYIKKMIGENWKSLRFYYYTHYVVRVNEQCSIELAPFSDGRESFFLVFRSEIFRIFFATSL